MEASDKEDEMEDEDEEIEEEIDQEMGEESHSASGAAASSLPSVRPRKALFDHIVNRYEQGRPNSRAPDEYFYDIFCLVRSYFSDTYTKIDVYDEEKCPSGAQQNEEGDG